MQWISNFSYHYTIHQVSNKLEVQLALVNYISSSLPPIKHGYKTLESFILSINKPAELVIGPSGVRALPLGVAAKRSVHYIWYWSERSACATLYLVLFFFLFLFLSVPHTFLPEGLIVGFQNFAWGFNSHTKKMGWKIIRGTPLPRRGGDFLFIFWKKTKIA